MLFLMGCETVNQTSSGICRGLKDPIDDLADALVESGRATPDRVIITSGAVINGYDAGCNP